MTKITRFFQQPSVFEGRLITWKEEEPGFGETYDKYASCFMIDYNYKLINELVLLLQNYDKGCEKLIDYIRENKNLKNNSYLLSCDKISKPANKCIVNILLHIYTILSDIRSNIIYPKFITKSKGDLYLYRAFNYNMYKEIFPLFEKNNNTTPCFLSFSVVENIAFDFIERYKDVNEKTIFWELIIPNHLLKIFHYTYLGYDINLRNKKQKIYGEYEFFLNLGAILKLVAVKENEFQSIKYLRYTYVFQGWDEEYQKKIEQMSFTLFKCLNNPV
uniref:Uncharacterized protein n=1 Tax=viral metagenome TaxID=1070528 RepID=A0A6C0CHR9_9ZZZZ